MWSKCTGVGRISINITSCRRLPSRNSSSFGSSRDSSHRQCCRSRNRVPRTRCATRCLCFVSIKLTTHLSKRNGMGITRQVRNKCSVSTKRGNKHKDTQRGNFEIGRILHLKSEIRNLQLDWQSNLKFRISDLRCRIRPISKFPLVYFVVNRQVGFPARPPARPACARPRPWRQR